MEPSIAKERDQWGAKPCPHGDKSHVFEVFFVSRGDLLE